MIQGSEVKKMEGVDPEAVRQELLGKLSALVDKIQHASIESFEKMVQENHDVKSYVTVGVNSVEIHVRLWFTKGKFVFEQHAIRK